MNHLVISETPIFKYIRRIFCVYIQNRNAMEHITVPQIGHKASTGPAGWKMGERWEKKFTVLLYER